VDKGKQERAETSNRERRVPSVAPSNRKSSYGDRSLYARVLGFASDETILTLGIGDLSSLR
jgi:hypothetical protein